ncbi:thioester reductase domain-containing protein, partial [Streptomyces sp. NPDC102283]|uniref:thioester reductase domain-containing protein n=1 Tax=Streptomyces sp. NPDC102283 TaxID=3366155 RepID=UPI0037F4C3CC
GTPIDWTTHLTPTHPHPTPLPTYAFHHKRYWISAQVPTGGSAATGHPLLGAPVHVAGTDTTVFTSQVSARTHPGLSGLSASALVELAISAGDHTGCTVLDRFTVTRPLTLAPRTTLQLQVRVTGGADSGAEAHQRAVSIHARPDGRPGAPWTEHAAGTMGFAGPDPAFDLGQWPPAGAAPVAGAPASDEVTGLWARGDELFAEVRLPEEARPDAARFGLHPALLEAAVRTSFPAPAGAPADATDPAADATDPAASRFAAEWGGVRLYATGATALRVRIAPARDGGMPSMQLADEDGQPVASLRSPAVREAGGTEPEVTGAGLHDSVFQVRWVPIALNDRVPPLRWSEATPEGLDALRAEVAAGRGPDAVLLRLPAASVSEGVDMPALAHSRLGQLLPLVQRWLADDALADTPLVVATTRAVATAGTDPVDPSATAVWGLSRSAQSEAPGRIVLVDVNEDLDLDLDGDLDGDLGPDVNGNGNGGAGQGRGGVPSYQLLTAALALREPQVALRGSRAFVPRLSPAAAPSGPPAANPWSGRGTVLITGGTGSLGALFARHLVTEHGVKRLLLTSRRGPAAPGADRLVAGLEELGARVTVAACDTADREALAALLAGIPAEHPLTGVVHTAGVLDDGLISAQSAEQLGRVLRPKADAAWHLHDLTQDLRLDAFVLFSSVAGVIGGPGQSNYAAANAFLDALAHHRATRGLAATSLAWGLWEQDGGMSGHLEEADLRRIARSGFRPLTRAGGPALMDAALALGHPELVVTPMDLGMLRDNAAEAPRVLAGLLTGPVRRIAQNTASGTSGTLGKQLAGLDEQAQHALLLALVRSAAAAVLGHTDTTGDAITAEQLFSSLGFDSLTSVELRNRLGRATGSRLPATLTFDHPTPTALAGYLREAVVDGAGGSGRARRAVDFRAEVRLDDDVRPAPGTVAVTDDPSEVLLTGATGFVGAFLLRDLMRSTSATIHCLVRGDSEPQALERIRANMQWYRIWDDVDTARLRIVLGDLAQPRLGLGEERFDALARTADVVYHAGATVHWLRPYTELKAANVGGTQEVLRLAARHRTVPVHYVSTVGVFAGPREDRVPLSVADTTGPAEILPTGYVQSKWVAEGVIGLARERGIPVSVYRVDVVSGDRESGACQTRDFVWLSLKGLLQAGAVPPGVSGEIHAVPVDYVSGAVLALSHRPGSLGSTFHLSNQNSLNYAEFVRYLRSSGYALKEVPLQEWQERITADAENPLHPLLEAFEVMASGGDSFYPAFDTSATEAALEGTGVTCPAINEELVARYVEFFVDSGYFPAVPGSR